LRDGRDSVPGGEKPSTPPAGGPVQGAAPGPGRSSRTADPATVSRACPTRPWWTRRWTAGYGPRWCSCTSGGMIHAGGGRPRIRGALLPAGAQQFAAVEGTPAKAHGSDLRRRVRRLVRGPARGLLVLTRQSWWTRAAEGGRMISPHVPRAGRGRATDLPGTGKGSIRRGNPSHRPGVRLAGLSEQKTRRTGLVHLRRMDQAHRPPGRRGGVGALRTRQLGGAGRACRPLAEGSRRLPQQHLQSTSLLLPEGGDRAGFSKAGRGLAETPTASGAAPGEVL